MSATIAQALILQLEAEGYPEGVELTLGIDNGVVYRGVVVSPERWIDDNRRGGWPDTFQYPLAQEPAHNTIHMIDVKYLSAGTWVAGSNAAVKVDRVTFLGDQH